MLRTQSGRFAHATRKITYLWAFSTRVHEYAIARVLVTEKVNCEAEANVGTRSACITRITRARYGLRNFRTQSKFTALKLKIFPFPAFPTGASEALLYAVLKIDILGPGGEGGGIRLHANPACGTRILY